MNKKGFFSLILKTACSLIVITFLLFYFLSNKDASQATSSTKAVIKTVAETAADIAQDALTNATSLENATEPQNAAKTGNITIPKNKSGGFAIKEEK